MNTKYRITPALWNALTSHCNDKYNTNYDLVDMYVSRDDTIEYLDEEYAMFYVEHSHFLRENEKYRINCLGDTVKINHEE